MGSLLLSNLKIKGGFAGLKTSSRESQFAAKNLFRQLG
jgi:hypothetical protein